MQSCVFPIVLCPFLGQRTSLVGEESALITVMSTALPSRCMSRWSERSIRMMRVIHMFKI